MASPVEFVSVLHQAKTQSQVWHHQTVLYAEHKALGHLYEGLTEFIDGFVESLQGLYPRFVGYTTKPLVDWEEGQSMEYVKMLCEYVEKERGGLGQMSWIQNEVDELQKLLYQIKYELSLK